MGKPPTYRLGADIPSDEVLRDSKGREVDESYVEQAVEEAIRHVRGRGRPSLSRSGESPMVRVRVPQELNEAVTRAAEREGVSRAEWVRHALDDAVRKSGAGNARERRKSGATGRSRARA